MNREEIIQSTIKHAEDLRMNIQNSILPSKEECEAVLGNLNDLREFVLTNNDTGVVHVSIEELFADFTQYAENSKGHLEAMLSLISEGKVPNSESVQELDLSIESLRQKYSSVYQAALAQLPADEMPGENARAIEFVEAVKNSKTLHLKKQLEEAAECLKKFISVRSLVEAYSTALVPYQDQAAEMLKSLFTSNDVKIEQLEERTAGPKAFLAAIECKDKDSEEGMVLCEDVAAYYPGRISFGVVRNQYFLDETVLEQAHTEIKPAEAAFRPIMEEVPAEAPSAQPAVGEALMPASDATNEVREYISNETPVEKAPAEEAPASDLHEGALGQASEPESDFVIALRTHSAFIPSDESVGKLSVESSPNENKKISSSVFTNEMKNGNVPAEKIIIQALVNRNCFNKEFLTEIKHVPSSIADGCIAYMLKKGYLCKYSIEPGGDIYCASSRLMKALSYMDACKFAGVRQRTIQDWGTSIESKAANAASRMAFTDLYNASVHRLTEKNVQRYTESVGIFTDSFCGTVYDTLNTADCELFFGAFWTDGKECDTFIDSVHEAFSKNGAFSAISVASLDLDHAAVLAKVVFEFLDDVTISVPVYLYSFADHTFYTYPNLDPVDKVEESPDPVEEREDVTLDVAEDQAADVTDTPRDSGEAGSEPAPEAKAPAQPPVIETAPAPAASPARVPVQMNAPVVPAKTKEMPSAVLNEIKANVYQMICERRFYAATAYLKSLSGMSDDVSRMYTQLAYALNDPMGHCSYSSNNAFNLISKQDAFENYLVIATALRMFFSNQVRYDYTIKSFYAGIKDYAILNNYPSLSNVIYTLADFKSAQKKGVDAYADYRAKSRTELEKEISFLKKEASSFYENFVVGRKKEKCSQKRFLETKTLMFSVNSEFGQYLKAVVDGDYELEALVAEFLRINFYDEESVIAEDTFDNTLVWNYIQKFWNEAGNHMTHCKRHEDLKSRLRSNITSETIRAIQILAKWSNLVERLYDHSDDAGTLEYKKVKKALQENLNDASDSIAAVLCSADENSEDAAGLTILSAAINDLSRCINGTFNENSRKYFYAPFLLTGDVILGEDLMPDFDVHSSSLFALRPDQRILKHLTAMKDAEYDYISRLHVILDEQGDDYGSARQIVDYLEHTSPDTNLEGIMSQIEVGELYARENADISREDFVGELELAQSYGQIDNSVEDKKEMILQIVNEWYEWAADTSNYGFFKNVMDAYLCDIREAAKSREHDLLEQLDKFKSETISGLSVEAKTARIKRIKEMIDDQNYTVAEDLLARSTIIEDENEEHIEEDFLKEFLDNYDDYYAPVAKHNANFSTLVSSRTRNKEGRGAKRLADNWLPGGSALGQNKLHELLNCLGFKIETVQKQPAIGKFENYFVKGSTSENGLRVVYTHPIAAFGSGIAEDGFRVVCINGMYDADGLIDIMKKIGDAKHTLILIDTALSKSERRRLARKTKNALGDKLFAVVDRTVMMFLVRNYDENKINRMLVSLIAPFGYYQPYVWDSANVMPPEIFMGRKNELERIKSATGVNIVYGGRQLGKSALLKKAKEDIDWDENNDRAVYIEIKGKNYEEAARKIGHELYDQFILEEDIETTDWDELSRAIKRRLQSTTAPKIPYLLLLLDEADTFIESCEAVNYKPFDALKEIQSIGAGRFKFVIAGLRNVVRFKREAALGNNSVLTHLQAMTVKPFNTSEARELLEIPLHYLGLRFPKEKEYLITLILATTNYFPGLIQLYCAKLLEAMRSKDYAGYDEANTPVYEISEGHIKKVLADPAFMQQIREKYEITLKLDEDNYYYLIALLMAYLYHSNGYSAGYSAADVKVTGADLGISRIASLDESKLAAFMEELKELNVLRSTDDTHYLFTRVAFFQMMGTSNEVDTKLESYMEG